MGNTVTSVRFKNTCHETLWISVTSESTKLQNTADNSDRDVPWYNKQRFAQRIGTGDTVSFDIQLSPNEKVICINGGSESLDLKITKSLHQEDTPCDVIALADGKLKISERDKATKDATSLTSRTCNFNMGNTFRRFALCNGCNEPIFVATSQEPFDTNSFVHDNESGKWYQKGERHFQRVATGHTLNIDNLFTSGNKAFIGAESGEQITDCLSKKAVHYNAIVTAGKTLVDGKMNSRWEDGNGRYHRPSTQTSTCQDEAGRSARITKMGLPVTYRNDASGQSD